MFNFSISRILGLIFISIVLLAAGIVMLFSSYIQTQSVYSIAREDANTRAELIFESIFAVMRNGMSRDEIDQIILRYNERLPSMRIGLVRSQSVADQFGDFPDALEARSNDKLVKQTFIDKKERILENGDHMRFIYPIRVYEECLSCHKNSKVDDINGILEISFPVKEISIPLGYAMNTIIIFFSFIVLFLIIMTIFCVRYFMVSPLLNLSEYMNSMRHRDVAKLMPKSSIYEIETLKNSFDDLMDHLNKANQDLKDLTIKDELTGLSNRRHFDEQVLDELQRAKRFGNSFTLFMLDLDKFKPINDEFGHDAGDYVLVTFANTLQNNLRATDCFARVGGDEFQIISPETDEVQAQHISDKLHHVIDTLEMTYQGNILQIGCSIGCATYKSDSETIEGLQSIADERMYANKKARKSGR